MPGANITQPDLSGYSSMPMSSYNSIPTIAAQNNTSFQQPPITTIQQNVTAYVPGQPSDQQLVYSPQHTMRSQIM